ncbi:MAG: hypothetical protein V4487_08205 [Chlamydiota bacterium]
MIPKSSDKYIHHQVEELARINQDKNTNYVVPNLCSLVAAISFNFFPSKEKLIEIPEEESPCTWTQSDVNNNKRFMAMGYPPINTEKDVADSLKTYPDDVSVCKHPYFGIAATRKL